MAYCMILYIIEISHREKYQFVRNFLGTITFSMVAIPRRLYALPQLDNVHYTQRNVFTFHNAHAFARTISSVPFSKHFILLLSILLNVGEKQTIIQRNSEATLKQVPT